MKALINKQSFPKRALISKQCKFICINCVSFITFAKSGCRLFSEESVSSGVHSPVMEVSSES